VEVESRSISGNICRQLISKFAKINVSVNVGGFCVCSSERKITGVICPHKQGTGTREVDIIPPQTVL
jgi:hypothetical protein